jgi:flagellar FliL protein
MNARAIREKNMPSVITVTRQKGLSKVLLISIIATVLLLIVIGVGVMLLMGGDDIGSFEDATSVDSAAGGTQASGQAQGQGTQQMRVANYWALEPPIIVNYDRFGKAGFLQVSITLMTYDSDVLLHVNTHAPAIRTHIILLFNGRKYEDLVGAENQIRLQNEVKDEINRQLRELAGVSKGIDAVYFTAFVMQ